MKTALRRRPASGFGAALAARCAAALAATRAAALAALLVCSAVFLPLAGAPDAAFAQTQSQPARSAPAPAASLLPTQAERERFMLLAEELRCLVCQNQTLADSDAELAGDLRREVEELMLAGRSNEQIKAHLVQRYGDFVLYRPPLQRNTWLLWLGPFALLVVGGFAWWRVQRSLRRAGSAADERGGVHGSERRAASSAAVPGTAAQGATGVDSDLERARRLLE